MKSINYFVKFIFTLLCLLLLNISVKAGYNYPYICDNLNCYNTSFGEINKNDGGYFVSNEKFSTINNLSTHINNKLNQYSTYYGNTKITISGFVNGTKVENKQVTFSQLIGLGQIQIGKKSGSKITVSATYSSGKDYLLTNFTTLINQFHSTFPSGERKNKLSDILSYIVYYDTEKDKIAIKNVCVDEKCYSSQYLLVSFNSTENYKFIYGDIKPNSTFVSENFKVSEDFYISNSLIKSGESINFNFKFEDYLNAGIEKTQYKYNIYYKYKNDSLKKFLSEVIEVSNDFKISSPNIEDDIINNIIDLDIIDSDSKKIRVGVKEGLTLTKAGEVQFYFAVTNLTTGENFENQLINYSPLEVLPSNTIQESTALITTNFSKALNDYGFNIGDTFSVTINLKDAFGNEQYDYIEGYEISLSDGSSSNIELAKAGSNTYSKVLTEVKSSQQSPYNIDLKFRITQSGYHKLNGFDIKARAKKDNVNYVTPAVYFSYEKIFPSNLYYGEQKMTIHIKSPEVNDFNITCSKGPITISTKCTSDDFSGCNAAQNKSVTFYNESENGSQGTISISDNAYNVKNFQYKMNHLDQTAPTVTFKLGNEILNQSSYNFKAKEGFYIDILDKTPSNCVEDNTLTYTLKINNVQILSKTTSELSESIDLGQYLKIYGTKVVNIRASDKYGNIQDKTITFNIYPTDDSFVLENQSTITVSSLNDKYADNSSFYEYTLHLKDKYGNPIINKNILLIEQNCNGFTGCKELKTNMVNSSGEKALIEVLSSNYTDSEGKIKFRVKSLTPGEFTQRFRVVFKEWGEDYVEGSESKEIYKTVINDNSFKIPFTGKLLASDDGSNYGILPSIGTNIYYKLEISSISSLNSIPITISNFSSYINIVDNVNTQLQNISAIAGLDSRNPIFSARINTSSGASELGGNPGIKISDNNKSPLVINYNIGGKNVSYYIGASDLATSRDIVKLESTTTGFLGVKIIGNKQGDGKLEITGQEENISNLSTFTARETIRKNAYSFVKSMTSNQTLNNVKYVVGDITISGNLPYETLVVKDGNVIISGDLNTASNKLGIIVLKDSYNLKEDFSNKGNIYINRNVKKINAVMYADGGIISSNTSGVPYVEDSAERTADLKNQLYIKGSLFTRNTIGGAILAGGEYILPGGSKTSNFDNAMIYDLNYLRTGNLGCDKNENGSCSDVGEFNQSTIIEYDPKIQSNPPKLFTN